MNKEKIMGFLVNQQLYDEVSDYFESLVKQKIRVILLISPNIKELTKVDY